MNDLYNRYLKLLTGIVQLDPSSAMIPHRHWEELLKLPLDQMIATLDPQQRIAIRLHYGLDDSEPLTYAVIGKKMHRSADRVGEIVRNGLSTLRYPICGRHFWLLYGIDKVLVPAKDGISRLLGHYDIVTTSVPDITVDELRASADSVMEHYRKYVSDEQDKYRLYKYKIRHQTHDPYVEKNWRARNHKK